MLLPSSLLFISPFCHTMIDPPAPHSHPSPPIRNRRISVRASQRWTEKWFTVQRCTDPDSSARTRQWVGSVCLTLECRRSKEPRLSDGNLETPRYAKIQITPINNILTSSTEVRITFVLRPSRFPSNSAARGVKREREREKMLEKVYRSNIQT